ncbi:MAG: hypothetical protein QF463_07345 [Vicinamibacterales bacterium]|nr:hypothetical protein [Vicinamibacterales bacterium]MDP6608864.1 hypothetical protein [Vicinamibacterales bacterium]
MQRLEDDEFHCLGQPWIHRPGQRQRIIDVLDDDGHRRLGLERYPPGRHFVEHDAERVDVATGVQRVSQPLLGRHVRRGADDAARLREALRAFQDLGHAEVGQQAVAPFVQQVVAGLDVTMDQSFGVGAVERISHLRHYLLNLIERQRPAVQRPRQRPGGDQRHDDVGEPVGFAEIVNREDVWVLEVGQHLGFLPKAAEELGVLGQMARQDLECDVALDRRLVGLVDRRHAALAERSDDAVGPKGSASQIFHDIRAVATSVERVGL